MDYKKLLESRIGLFISKSKTTRSLIMNLYKKQQSRKWVALVPIELMEKYGEKEIIKKIKNHKKTGDFYIGNYLVKFIKPNIDNLN